MAPPQLSWPGKTDSPAPAAPALRRAAAYGELPASNLLLAGDNLRLMAGLRAEWSGKVDLVYLDPPFYAGHDWALPGANGCRKIAFSDRWATPDEYLRMLYERLRAVRELLSARGSLILHVNWRVAHWAQCLLDELFGAGEREAAGAPGFRTEIVWGYGGGGAARRTYRRKHDNLFWYTKSGEWTFHPQYRPYTTATRQRGLTAVKGPRYALRAEGATLETWWTDPEVQKILSPTAAENLKYPTQKPEALLRRIIRGHSSPGEVVADFFCGSGTTGAVAHDLGRRWLMADSSPHAIGISVRRMRARGAGFELWEPVEP